MFAKWLCKYHTMPNNRSGFLKHKSTVDITLLLSILRIPRMLEAGAVMAVLVVFCV